MKSIIAITLLLLTGAPAAPPRLTVRSRHAEPLARGSREAQVCHSALDMFAFGGATWVVHHVVSRDEPTPIGITRIDRSGTRLFLAYEWLPAGSVPSGSVGQIYAVAPLPRGLMAAAVGYRDQRGQSRNSIVILDDDGSGGYACVREIDAPGVRRIIAGPSDSIVALMADPKNGRVALFDLDGARLGDFFPPAATFEAADHSRLAALGGSRFALYANDTRRVTVFSVDGRPARATVLREFSVADAGVALSQRRASIDDFFAVSSGRVTVTRTGKVGDRYQTVMTVYEPDGSIRGVWVSDEPFKRVTRAGSAIRAIFAKEDVQLETIELDE